MNNDDLQKKVRAGNFVANNGRVLRTINLLRYQYNKLQGIAYALTDLQEDEFLDCINYLTEAGYIELRHVETDQAVMDLADCDYRLLKAKLTAKGIQLLAYATKDPLIKV